MNENKKNGRKKIIFLLMAVALVLIGCGETDGPNSSLTNETLDLDDGIELVRKSEEIGNTYSSSKIPFNIKYEEMSIKCISLEAYQEESEHGYFLYVVASIDMGELSETNLYWLDEEKSLDIRVHLSDEKNDLESESLYNLCVIEKDDIRYYVFDLSDECRYPFNDSSLSLSIDIDNDKMYDTYHYYTDTKNIKDISEIDQEIYNAMHKAYLRQLEVFEDLMNDY